MGSDARISDEETDPGSALNTRTVMAGVGATDMPPSKVGRAERRIKACKAIASAMAGKARMPRGEAIRTVFNTQTYSAISRQLMRLPVARPPPMLPSPTPVVASVKRIPIL